MHTLLYSLLLLNTDMHLADIPSSQKMTRSQFIKNTMSTIRRSIQDATAAELEEQEQQLTHSSSFPLASQALTRNKTDDSQEMKGHKARSSMELGKEHKGSRLSRIGNLGSLSPRMLPDDHAGDKGDHEADGGTALVNAPHLGGLRLWESQLEGVLKGFYHSIKVSALPLHGTSQDAYLASHHSSGGLSVFGNSGILRRSPSTISKAASEMSGGTRGRDNTKLGTNKWSSKNRSRQRVYNGSFAGSSRTSLEERSMWSPSASSTWSKYTLDKTQTSMSVNSLDSSFTHSEYQQSVGFAGALSNAIIREEGASATSCRYSQAFTVG